MRIGQTGFGSLEQHSGLWIVGRLPPQVLYVQFVSSDFARDFRQPQVKLRVFEPRQQLTRLDRLSRFDQRFGERARYRRVDALRHIGFDNQRRPNSMRKRHKPHCTSQQGKDNARDGESSRFHFLKSPRNCKELSQFPQWHQDQSGERNSDNRMANNLQTVRLEHPVDELHDDAENEPSISKRCDAIQREPKVPSLRQAASADRLHPQTMDS